LTRQQQALAIYPDLAEAHFNLGAVLQARGRLAEAEQSFRQALALKPGYVDPHVNLGALLQSQGRLDDATESLRAALVLAPQHADARNNLATVLLDQGRTDTAIEHLLTALRANAASPEVHCNLGAALQRLGSVDAAIEHYRAAIELDPGLLDAHSNLLFMLSFHAECSPAEYLAEARRYGAKLAARVRALPNRPEAAAADPMRPLRVGMVSGDLKAHPVGYFVESLLNSLDRRRVELIAYPTQPREDDLTARLKPLFAAWSPIFGSSDEEAARRIHADGIDILIDLAGHSAHNRLPVFAWRPAPVQLTWLGYFASTGVPGIDTLIADPVSVPERHRAHFSETICYLPDTRLCFTPPRAAATLAVAPLPALTNGHLTFGCFQASSKINEHVLAAWGRIFQALSGARLRLQNQEMGTPSARSTMLARLGAVGLAAERVTLVGATPRDEYLAAHGEVDIILDTFPYPGGTTTCEALWMGVPTLTLVGETMLSRQGAALMACVGLTEWVAGDEEDYVDRALGHAADLNRLAGLRQGLRQQVLASPLFDAPRFASRLESLLQGLWAKRTTELRGDN
jgi:protein O-GlcNAc transferase